MKSDKEGRQRQKQAKKDEKDDSMSEDNDEESDIIESNDYELNEHVDCRDSVNKWLDAEIIGMRTNEIRVHFTGWANKFDEWISRTSDRIQKQWTKGKKFKLNNRLDIKDEQNKWLEARVTDMNQTHILIHYYNFSSKFDSWIDKTSDRIAEIGKYSKGFGQINNKIKPSEKNKASEPSDCSSHHSTIIKPHEYASELYKNGFIIRPIGEDGNCLFRSISDQIYGTEKYHSEIRSYCLKYIEIEHEYFRNFIEGGNNLDTFYLYIEKKKKDGVWGDDVEIQALSEIYNKPIEIYVYSSKPIRTFHENSFGGNEPIRLSYHGKSHYNSIKRREGVESIKLVKEKFGETEEKSLETAKIRLENKKNNNSVIDKCLLVSRNEFEIRNIRELEQALEESFKLNEKAVEMKEIEDQMLQFTVKQYEQDNPENIEKILIEQAIQDSMMTQSKNNKEDYDNIPAILKVVQEGFPLELVIKAYNIVGDDPSLMIQFISENMLS